MRCPKCKAIKMSKADTISDGKDTAVKTAGASLPKSNQEAKALKRNVLPSFST